MCTMMHNIEMIGMCSDVSIINSEPFKPDKWNFEMLTSWTCYYLKEIWTYAPNKCFQRSPGPDQNSLCLEVLLKLFLFTKFQESEEN